MTDERNNADAKAADDAVKATNEGGQNAGGAN